MSVTWAPFPYVQRVGLLFNERAFRMFNRAYTTRLGSSGRQGLGKRIKQVTTILKGIELYMLSSTACTNELYYTAGTRLIICRGYHQQCRQSRRSQDHPAASDP